MLNVESIVALIAVINRSSFCCSHFSYNCCSSHSHSIICNNGLVVVVVVTVEKVVIRGDLSQSDRIY